MTECPDCGEPSPFCECDCCDHDWQTCPCNFCDSTRANRLVELEWCERCGACVSPGPCPVCG